MKKLMISLFAMAALGGGAFAQQGGGSSTSLNVNPYVHAMPNANISGLNPSTLNGSAIGSGNLNGNTLITANGNRFANGNMVGNGSLNGTRAGNNLSNYTLNGLQSTVSGNRTPVLNSTHVITR